MKDNIGNIDKNLENIIMLIKLKFGDKINDINIELLIERAESSICQIIKNDGYGIGFFCMILNPDISHTMYCLITNNNVINKEMIERNNYIELILNKQRKKINLKNNRKIWINEELNYVCIAILEEDKLLENIKPFNINDNCYNENYKLINYDEKEIVLGGNGQNKEIEYFKGVSYYIDKQGLLIYHDCNNEQYLSGGPIILLDDLSIIGIYNGFNNDYNDNNTTYFGDIIYNIKNENNKKDNQEKNQILCGIYIDKDYMKEDISLFRYKGKKQDVNVYINRKKINIKKDKNRWKIENCETKIVNEMNEIMIKFNNPVTDINI